MSQPHEHLPPPFACTSRRGGVDSAWVQVGGELDLATAPRLVEALRDARHGARRVVLDLRELTFLDSAGVHAIVDASIGARRDGRRLLLLRAPDAIHRIFALTGTSDDVEVFDLDPAGLSVQVLLQESRGSVAAS